MLREIFKREIVTVTYIFEKIYFVTIFSFYS